MASTEPNVATAATLDSSIELISTELINQATPAALAIDPGGTVKGCRIVAESGAMTPDYGCAEASAERFQASARDA